MRQVFIYLRRLLKENDTVVIGVSTGPDSMCLLSILESLSIHINIIVCHVNHNVRKESLEEEEYIREYCQKHNLLLEVKKLAKIDKNFESRARSERYAFFRRIVKKYNANYLMTAHHGDDLVETILIRQLRGSNMRGYAGFSLCTYFDTYQLVRPLIYVTKEDILKYLDDKKIKYYIDKTNLEDNHIRNRIRHNILPILKKENKNIHLKYLEYSEELSSSDKILQKISNEITNKVYNDNRVDIDKLKNEDQVIVKRVMENILSSLYSNLDNITSKHVNSIIDLINSGRPNGKINLPNMIVVQREYNYLYFKREILCKNDKLKEEKPLLLELKEYNKYYNQVIRVISKSDIKSNYVLRLDSKEIKLPLYIRLKRPGDKMFIKNFYGYKKVSDILIDSKVPKCKRDKLLIVVDSNNEVLWIPGVKKAKFDKEKDEKYDIILEYVYEGENI